MPRPDVYDIRLMLGVRKRDSITEMAEETGLSLSGVHQRLEYLEDLITPLINPPRKPGAARDRTLTSEGETYLKTNGYLPSEKLFP